MFRLPYSLFPMRTMERISGLGLGETILPAFPFLNLHLKQAEVEYTAKEYLSMCVVASSFFFLFIGISVGSVLFFAGVRNFLVFSFLAAFFVTLFVFSQQLAYPKIFVNRRVKNLERNLLPALQSILVQLNSGVPLFDILVNISKEEYGEVSKEFSKAVRDIHSGRPEIETLEEMAAINPSLFFRRSVWQIVNGMKSGADMSSVINETIHLLSEEQLLQIQRYGSQLNPLAMFYMLVVVIGPSLGMTFLIILSSFIALSEGTVKIVFWVLYGIVVFFQLMFIGIIKAKRPNLLGE